MRRHFPNPSRYAEISRPVRFFKSDLLERFTHTRLATLVAFWGSISVGLLVIGLRQGELTGIEAGAIATAGAIAWSLVEYLLHRFVFHLDRWLPAAERFCFLMHGCHHADPSDGSRDVMPLVASVPALGAFLGLALWTLGTATGAVFAGAFGLAYLAYDVMHYGFHQWRLPGRLGSYLKRHHLMHHFRDDGSDFGVTSPLWDWIFGTFRISGG